MTKKVIVTDEQLEQISNLKYLNHGAYANVYEYKDFIVKMFYSVIESKYFKDGETFVDFESKLIHTPAILLLSEEKDVIGYVRKKIKGQTLEEIVETGIYNTDFDLSLDELLKLLEDIKIEIDHVSKKGILMYDVNYGNIVLNNNMHVIDTDCFYHSGNSSEELYKMNCEIVEETILEFFSELNENLTEKILKDISEEYNGDKKLYKFVDAAKKYKTKRGTYIKSMKDFL